MKADWRLRGLFGLLVVWLVLVFYSWMADAWGANVRSVISPSGIRWFFVHSMSGLCRPQAVWLFLLLSGWGVGIYTGFLNGFLRQQRHSSTQRMAFRLACGVGCVYTLAVVLLVCWPNSVLLNVEGTWYPSSFSAAAIPIVYWGWTFSALAYGYFSGKVQTGADLVESLVFGIKRYSWLLLYYVLVVYIGELVSFVFSL